MTWPEKNATKWVALVLAGGKNCNKNTFLPHKKLNVKEAFNQIKSVFHFYKLCKMWIIIMWNLMLRNYKKDVFTVFITFCPFWGNLGKKWQLRWFIPHTPIPTQFGDFFILLTDLGFLQCGFSIKFFHGFHFLGNW